MVGIVGYGVYIPRYRIKTEEIAGVWGEDGPAMASGLGVFEKSVPGPDEDVATISTEAARNAIVNEIYSTMKTQKADVDIRHITLLADAMTADGEVVSIGRHGLSGRKQSVLARAAFEETVKHLVNAAINGEEDKLNGIVENILIGQPVPLGTGLVKLRMKQGFNE